METACKWQSPALFSSREWAWEQSRVILGNFRHTILSEFKADISYKNHINIIQLFLKIKVYTE